MVSSANFLYVLFNLLDRVVYFWLSYEFNAVYVQRKKSEYFLHFQEQK